MANSLVLAAEGIAIEGIRETFVSRPLEFGLLFGSQALGEGEGATDVDIALLFPESMDDRERIRERNRIDAAHQENATGFIDVSDTDAVLAAATYVEDEGFTPMDALHLVRSETDAIVSSETDYDGVSDRLELEADANDE